MTRRAEFDGYAGDYEAALQQGLSVSGESAEYFAQARVKHLQRWLVRLDHPVGRVLDFGCGTGTAIPFLLDILAADACVGIDISEASLAVARQRCDDGRVSLQTLDDSAATPDFELAYCNGVFHHIPREQQHAAAKLVYERLQTGGLFAFWENNPFSPAARYVMSQIPFDRDAVMLSPRRARHLLSDVGFEVLATEYHFYFPRMLGRLRPLESALVKVPLGAQYMVLARKA